MDFSVIRNRIRRHVRVRAGDLVRHELNARRHAQAQRRALVALYEEVGFARSLLAYELPDGRLKLIDGHLRESELDPDEMIDVEILDVDDAEARKLLLSIDPLAQLADYDNRTLDALRRVTESDNQTLNALWASLRKQDQDIREKLERAMKTPTIPEQYLVLIECGSEAEQVELLGRFQTEGLKCKALLS